MGRKRLATGASGDLTKVARAAFWTFVAALAIQAAHFLEHVIQIHQFVWLASPRPQGAFGAVFDFAWVHFAYNAGIFVAIVWCYALWVSNRGIWRESRWGAFWFHSLVAFQGYHVVEHTVQMYQYYRYDLLVPPGIIGKIVPNIIAHFDINGIMTLQMLVVLLVFQPGPRPHAAAAPATPTRLPGGFRTGVLGSGGVAVLLVALIVLFANSTPAATVVPLASDHCLDRPAAGPETADAGWSFADVTAASGISHVVGATLPPMGRTGLAGTTAVASKEETHPMRSLLGGLAVADVDGDGWQDFLVTDEGPDVLYRNNGDGTFDDVTSRAGLGDPAPGRAAAFFDADGDLDPDLYVTNFGAPSRFYRNDGGLAFVDVTASSGLGRSSTPHGVAAVDVDGDGDLDVSVANYGRWTEHTAESQADARNGDRDFLFINDGAGNFTEEGLARGLDQTLWSFSHAWADFDRDGDQDLYVNVDFGVDRLYVNDGAGHFTEAASEHGMFSDGNGMGAVWVDHDNDADLDLFATAIRIECNRDVPQFKGNDLFVNDGTGRFAPGAVEAGIADGLWGWDSEWVDFDHDGDLDAFQATGWSTRGEVDRYHDALTYLSDEAPKQLTERNQGEQPSLAYMKYNATKYVIWSFYPPLAKGQLDDSSQGGHQVDRFWLNGGTGRFKDAAGSVGFTSWTDSRAGAAIDFDNDGDMDLLRTAWQRPVQLFENPAEDAGSAGHWLKVRLVGTESNTDASGAVVRLEAGGVEMQRLLGGGGGFLSQSENVAHFGLGTSAIVERIVIEWPSGRTTELADVVADQTLRIVEA